MLIRLNHPLNKNFHSSPNYSFLLLLCRCTIDMSFSFFTLKSYLKSPHSLMSMLEISMGIFLILSSESPRKEVLRWTKLRRSELMRSKNLDKKNFFSRDSKGITEFVLHVPLLFQSLDYFDFLSGQNLQSENYSTSSTSYGPCLTSISAFLPNETWWDRIMSL